MKILKIALATLGLFLVLFLAAALLIPRLYKEELLEVVREQANQNLNATLDFRDLDISLFRQFPLLSIRLDSLSITGQDPFEGYELIRAREILVAVSVWDLFRKNQPLQVRRIHLNEPRIQVLVLEDGRANYDITIPDSLALPEEEVPSQTLGLSLRDYSIRNGYLRYEDRSMPALVDLAGLNHRGSGDFADTRFDLDTRTTIDSLTARYDGITWLNRANASLDARLGMDTENMVFTLKDNALRINALNLNADGRIAMPGEDIDLDMTFKAPSNSLRELWSIIPGAYTADFAGLESSGTFDLNFWIKGLLTEEDFPAFALETRVADGRVKYPALPYGIEQIALELSVRQPGNRLENMEIDLPRFRFSVNKQPLSGFLSLRDPLRDPDVHLGLEGTLDLNDWRQAFPVDAREISGRIAADLNLKARMSALDEGRYEDTDIRGEARLSAIRYQSSDQPAIQISEGLVRFSPQFVDARDFHIQAGRSDIALDARVDNILAFIHPERTLKGRMTLRSQLLDLDEWASDTPSSGAALPEEEEVAVGLPTEQFDLALDAGIARLVSGDMEVKDLKIIGEAGPRSLNAREVSGRLGRSDFFLTGQLENLLGWLSGSEVLRGNVQFRSRLLDLNELMPAEEAPASQEETASAPIPVPADVQVRATARIDQLIYTDLDLRNVEGALAIGDQTVLLEDFRADGLGGRMIFSGAYVAQDISRPEFHFKYDLQQLDFRQVFAKVNTFRQLAPVGEYLQGRFSSNMVIDGVFDQTMTPVIGSINAAGFLETFNTLLKGFKPLEGLADKLNIAELKTMDLKNSRNWFEIVNGVVELKEFDYQYRDIAMRIGGRHSLEQDMDYQVKAKIPRKYLDKTGITAQANTGLKWLEAEAARKGLKVSLGEFVNLAIGIGGTMTNPSYSLRVLGTEGEAGPTMEDQVREQIADVADKVRDTLTETARRKAEELEAEARARAQAQLDTLKRQAESKVDSAVARAKEEAARKVGDEASKKLEELGGDKAKQEADKLKDQIKKWDPLGRKRD